MVDEGFSSYILLNFQDVWPFIFRLGSCSWICPKGSTSPRARAGSPHFLGLRRFESLCLNIFAVKFSWKKKQERYRYDVKEGFDPLLSEAGERPPFFSQPLTVNIAKDSEGIGDSDAPWFSNGI